MCNPPDCANDSDGVCLTIGLADFFSEGLRPYSPPLSHSIWSGMLDSNQRPSAPKADALPDCANPREG